MNIPAELHRQRPHRRRRRVPHPDADRAAAVQGGHRGGRAVLRGRLLELVLQRACSTSTTTTSGRSSGCCRATSWPARRRNVTGTPVSLPGITAIPPTLAIKMAVVVVTVIPAVAGLPVRPAPLHQGRHHRRHQGLTRLGSPKIVTTCEKSRPLGRNAMAATDPQVVTILGVDPGHPRARNTVYSSRTTPSMSRRCRSARHMDDRPAGQRQQVEPAPVAIVAVLPTRARHRRIPRRPCTPAQPRSGCTVTPRTWTGHCGTGFGSPASTSRTPQSRLLRRLRPAVGKRHRPRGAQRRPLTVASGDVAIEPIHRHETLGQQAVDDGYRLHRGQPARQVRTRSARRTYRRVRAPSRHRATRSRTRCTRTPVAAPDGSGFAVRPHEPRPGNRRAWSTPSRYGRRRTSKGGLGRQHQGGGTAGELVGRARRASRRTRHDPAGPTRYCATASA